MVTELRLATMDNALPKSVASGVEFHRSLVNGLGRPRISRMYEAIIGEVQLAIAQVQGHHLEHPANIADQHEEILQAIARKQEKRAVDMLTQHLDSAEDSLRRDAMGQSEQKNDVTA